MKALLAMALSSQACPGRSIVFPGESRGDRRPFFITAAGEEESPPMAAAGAERFDPLSGIMLKTSHKRRATP